jgi:NAD+ synthase (glutamine-hydrolysing)
MRIGLLQLTPPSAPMTKIGRESRKPTARRSLAAPSWSWRPELAICGYPPRDLLLREDFIQRGLDALEELARQVGPVPLIAGYVERNSRRPGRPLCNAAAVLQNGKIVQRVTKSLLPTYDVFDEDRYFEPAEKIAPVEIAGRKIALTICEDIWNDADFWPERRYRRDPIRELIGAGRVDREYLRLALGAGQGERGGSPCCSGSRATRGCRWSR